MRIREIDVLRGFAIVLVILGHAFIVHPVDVHDVLVRFAARLDLLLSYGVVFSVMRSGLSL